MQLVFKSGRERQTLYQRLFLKHISAYYLLSLIWFFAYLPWQCLRS